MTNPGLLTLPTELILLIVESLPLQRDLNALVCSSKYLSIILIDLLFHRNIKQHSSSALLSAASQNHTHLALRLIRLGASTEVSSKRLYQHGRGNTPGIRSFSHIWVKANRNEEFTPLCYAIRYNNARLVQALVKAGARVKVDFLFGPFTIAFERKNESIILALLQGLKTVNAIVASQARTPLHLACETDMVGLVRKLLEMGADPNMKIGNFDPPYDYVHRLFGILDERLVDAKLRILQLLFMYGLQPDASLQRRGYMHADQAVRELFS